MVIAHHKIERAVEVRQQLQFVRVLVIAEDMVSLNVAERCTGGHPLRDFRRCQVGRDRRVSGASNAAGKIPVLGGQRARFALTIDIAQR